MLFEDFPVDVLAAIFDRTNSYLVLPLLKTGNHKLRSKIQHGGVQHLQLRNQYSWIPVDWPRCIKQLSGLKSLSLEQRRCFPSIIDTRNEVKQLPSSLETLELLFPNAEAVVFGPEDSVVDKDVLKFVANVEVLEDAASVYYRQIRNRSHVAFQNRDMDSEDLELEPDPEFEFEEESIYEETSIPLDIALPPSCKRLKSVENTTLDRIHHEVWDLNSTHPSLTCLKVGLRSSTFKLETRLLRLLPHVLTSLSIVNAEIEGDLSILGTLFPQLTHLCLGESSINPVDLDLLPSTLVSIDSRTVYGENGYVHRKKSTSPLHRLINSASVMVEDLNKIPSNISSHPGITCLELVHHKRFVPTGKEEVWLPSDLLPPNLTHLSLRAIDFLKNSPDGAYIEGPSSLTSMTIQDGERFDGHFYFLPRSLKSIVIGHNSSYLEHKPYKGNEDWTPCAEESAVLAQAKERLKDSYSHDLNVMRALGFEELKMENGRRQRIDWDTIPSEVTYICSLDGNNHFGLPLGLTELNLAYPIDSWNTMVLPPKMTKARLELCQFMTSDVWRLLPSSLTDLSIISSDFDNQWCDQSWKVLSYDNPSDSPLFKNKHLLSLQLPVPFKQSDVWDEKLETCLASPRPLCKYLPRQLRNLSLMTIRPHIGSDMKDLPQNLDRLEIFAAPDSRCDDGWMSYVPRGLTHLVVHELCINPSELVNLPPKLKILEACFGSGTTVEDLLQHVPHSVSVFKVPKDIEDYGPIDRLHVERIVPFWRIWELPLDWVTQTLQFGDKVGRTKQIANEDEESD